MPGEPVARRRLVSAAGGGYASDEIDMATVLYNTYKQERRRYEEKVGRPARFDELKWESDFAGLVENRRTENVENMKRDGTPRMTRRTVWLSVARKLLTRRIDPQAFIRRIFFARELADGVPEPEYFDTQAAVDSYERAGQALDREISVAFRNSLVMFETAMVKTPGVLRAKGEDYVWAYVLSDRYSGLGTLFRYCTAIRLKADKNCKNPELFERIIERFRNPAAMEYLFAADLYDRYWSELLPPNYRAEAEAIYDRLFSRNVLSNQDDDFGTE